MRRTMTRGLLVLMLLGCEPRGGRVDDPAPAAPAEVPAAAAPEPAPSPEARCQTKIEAHRRLPALPGAPELERRRAELLARAKAEPVIFLRLPQFDPNAPAEAGMYRAEIERNPSPGWALHRLYKNWANRPEIARALLLREGYLFADSPALGAALVDRVELHHLYRDGDLVIERGDQRLLARKGNNPWYEYVDGPEAGARARLLLFDRVSPVDAPLGAPLHVSAREVAVTLGFERLRRMHVTDDAVLAEARYGPDWVPTLFHVRGTRLELDCELVDEAAKTRVARARELAVRRARMLGVKRGAIVSMVREALPFDEPITEIGQQDGNLRPAWLWAYRRGWDMYTFNDDHYLVFDGSGRPKVPQVCIDFITDTLERASGTWFAPKSEGERRRTSGGVDFDQLPIENRRSVEVFNRFTRERPEWFDVYDLAPSERVRFVQREQFFAELAANADRYLPGDVVTILGPRSDGESHWHSFFVYDSDPVTGMPLLLASNAGRPRIRTWEAEMRSAPLRSIQTRIRFRLEWLERVLPQSSEGLLPAPLISAPI